MTNLRETLLVCAFGFDARSHTALQLFFRTKCSDTVKLVGDDEAQVGIIDMDSVTAARIYADQRARFPNRVLILFSLEEREALPNTFHVRKPVQIEIMIQVLDKVRTRVLEPPSPHPVFSSEMDQPKVSASTQAKKVFVARPEPLIANRAATLLDEQEFEEYIGSLKDVDPNDAGDLQTARYDPKHYLQGFLQSACKVALNKNSVLRLNTGWKPFIIFPQTREILIEADDCQLRSFCLVPVHSISDLEFGEMDGGIMTISPVGRTRIERQEFDSTKLQRMDALIWKIALWTSAGRVPEDIDLVRPVYLRHWPNFTRILLFPNALRIAALLSEHPRSLLDIARALSIRQQYVFAFFSAARALGLADQATRQSEQLLAAPSVEPKSNSGVLRKILQRLLGW